MIEPDPYASDPFFKRVFDGDWNACIGKQGNEENYLDGYIDAAIELADAIIEKKLLAKRDTLVLPILYNARHAIELALKFATDRLIAAGVIKNDGRRRNHNIKVYWDRLDASAVGDEKLLQTIKALKPFIDSLAQIDSDGQELRYHRNMADDPSLANYSIANLKLIQASLRALEKLLSDLKYRTLDFIDEHETGSHTNRCSRRDLFAIARLLPSRDLWGTEAFDEQKAAIRAQYGLGNRQFSIALDRIQENREMRAILGMESDLRYLKDDDIVWVIEQWRRLHPVRELDEDDLGIDYFNPERFAEMQQEAALRGEVGTAIEKRLSPEALADLEAIFYLARDRIYAEYYEDQIARVRRQHEAAKEPEAVIQHLMEKTNFLQCMLIGAARLGRLGLAERLKGM